MRTVQATSADVQKLTSFFLQAWKEAGPGALGFTGATEETINEITSEEFLKERLSDAAVKMFIVEENGKILGFAATRVMDENAIELSGVIVLESATGKGFGTILIREVISYARQVGVQKIIVKTEVLNQRAISFYRKMGFVEVGKATEDVEGKGVDVVVLEKTFR